MKFCKYWHLSVVIIAGLILSSCSQNISHSQAYSDQEMRDMAANLNVHSIVDCVPPPKVRSRGGSIYLKKSRPLRTTVLDCRDRAGEFTVNANRQTRLEIWQARANDGDVEAQTYVGEIYEKGLGTAPDYAFAALWYKKAAEHGSKRAQNNLGFLHEKGLGVPKDHKLALKWYQKAAGVNPESPLNSTLQLKPDAIKELTRLRKEISLKSSEAEQLHQQLETAQAEAQAQADQIQLAQVQAVELPILRGIANENEALLQQNQIESERLQAQNKDYIERLALLSNKINTLEDELQDSNQSQSRQSELIDKINRKTLETERLKVSLHESQRQLVNSQNDITARQQNHSTQQRQQAEKITQLTLIIAQLKSRLADTNKTLEIDKQIFSNKIWKGVDFGEYHALIIGNTQYTNLATLRTPVNDAKRLNNILIQKYGFKTKLLLNANRGEITDALAEYQKSLDSKDSLLIFYAGHGVLTDVRGYWQGVDSTSDSISDWISNVDITDQLEQLKAKHVLVVVDSCYSGAISRGSIEELNPEMKGAEKLDWVKQKHALISRIAITSGGLYPVSDGAGKHSVFAHAFIKHLETNQSVLAARSLFNTIEPRVISRSKDVGTVQTPEYARLVGAADENGEFYFKPLDISARIKQYQFASLLWELAYTGKKL